MFDAPNFLHVLTGNFDKRDEGPVGRFRARLDEINYELDALREQSDAALPEHETLFDKYIAVLADKCAEVEAELENLDPSEKGRDFAQIREDLNEANQRLRIARRAAKARFRSLIH